MELKLPKPRPISAAEVALIRKSIEVGATEPISPDALASLDAQHVVPGCSCGCASFDIVTEIDFRPRDIAHATQMLPEGYPLGIIVWGTSERIHGVEIWDVFNAPLHILPRASEVNAEVKRGRVGRRYRIARAVVTNELGEVLLVRQTYMPGWRLPGGFVGRKESSTPAIFRELREEVGVVPALAPTLIFARGITVIYFVDDWRQETPTQKWEVAEARFFPPDDLPGFTTPLTRKAVGALLKSRTAA